MKNGIEEGKPQEPEIYEAKELFASRNQTLPGDEALLVIIVSELAVIQEAPPELLRKRYLSTDLYVPGLVGETGSPHDFHDAYVIDAHLRRPVEERARQLGITIPTIEQEPPELPVI